jgi:hypothetical protein
MDRMKTVLANPQNSLNSRADMPTLHPDPIQRLRRSIFTAKPDRWKVQEAKDGDYLSRYNRVDSVAAWKKNGRFVDLNCWPTPNDAAAA